MRNSARPGRPRHGRQLRHGRQGEGGFALVEMLVAMVLLGLVGLTLARFQTLQLHGASTASLAAAQRIVADNLAVDVLVAPDVPTRASAGTVENFGRRFEWSLTPSPRGDGGQGARLIDLALSVTAENGRGPATRRSLLRLLPPAPGQQAAEPAEPPAETTGDTSGAAPFSSPGASE